MHRLRLRTEDEIHTAIVTRSNEAVFVSLDGRDYRFEIESSGGRGRRHEHHEGEVSLPMPGKVVSVQVEEGQAVTRGQPLLVVEAMKMEHTLKAPRDGTVVHLVARAGEMVEAGTPLLELTE